MGSWLNSLRVFEIRGLTAKYKLQLKWNVNTQKKAITYVHSLILQNMIRENITTNEFDNLANQLNTGKIDRNILNNAKRDIYTWEITKIDWCYKLQSMDDLLVIGFYTYLRNINQLPRIHGVTPRLIKDNINDLTVNRYDLLYRQFLEEVETSRTDNRNPIPQQPTINIKMGIDQEMYSEECPLCYETMDFEKNIKTNCSHEFCVDCITRFLPTCKNRAKCPMCRGPITEMVCHSTASFNVVCPFVKL
jgi:hypothetical protein